MFYSSFTLLGALSISLVSNVSAFSCKVNGISVNCPTFRDNSDQDFCCDDYCCDFNQYAKHNSGPPIGMIVAFVVISVIILTIGCCCYIARRRAEERALLGFDTEPITAVPNATYPHQFHPPPAPIAYNQPLPYEPPPPYAVAPPPYPAQQPHLNPYYRSEERKF